MLSTLCHRIFFINIQTYIYVSSVSSTFARRVFLFNRVACEWKLNSQHLTCRIQFANLQSCLRIKQTPLRVALPLPPGDWHFPHTHTHMTIDAMSCPICCSSTGLPGQAQCRKRKRQRERIESTVRR